MIYDVTMSDWLGFVKKRCSITALFVFCKFAFGGNCFAPIDALGFLQGPDASGHSVKIRQGNDFIHLGESVIAVIGGSLILFAPDSEHDDFYLKERGVLYEADSNGSAFDNYRLAHDKNHLDLRYANAYKKVADLAENTAELFDFIRRISQMKGSAGLQGFMTDDHFIYISTKDDKSFKLIRQSSINRPFQKYDVAQDLNGRTFLRLNLDGLPLEYQNYSGELARGRFVEDYFSSSDLQGVYERVKALWIELCVKNRLDSLLSKPGRVFALADNICSLALNVIPYGFQGLRTAVQQAYQHKDLGYLRAAVKELADELEGGNIRFGSRQEVIDTSWQDSSMAIEPAVSDNAVMTSGASISDSGSTLSDVAEDEFVASTSGPLDRSTARVVGAYGRKQSSLVVGEDDPKTRSDTASESGSDGSVVKKMRRLIKK